MTHDSTIQSVIFDMDGLMFDTERIALHADIRAGRDFGYTLPESLVIGTVGLNLNDTRNYYQQHFGPDYPFDDIRNRRYEYASQDIREHGLPTKAGLIDLLGFLKSKSVSKAVATSSDRDRTESYLAMAGIRHAFDAVVCGRDVAHGKPEPDIFLKAADLLGCPVQSCLVLEDSEHGILAASKAGIGSILVPDLKMPKDSIARLAIKTLPDLHEVRLYLERVL